MDPPFSGIGPQLGPSVTKSPPANLTTIERAMRRASIERRLSVNESFLTEALTETHDLLTSTASVLKSSFLRRADQGIISPYT